MTTLRDALRIFWKSGGIEGQLEKVDESGRALPLAMGVPDREKIVDAPLLERGEVGRPGKPVPRGFPRVVAIADAAKVPADRSGRLELARWLTHPDHPLTARVMANRVWRHLFGAGLVRTVDNFGFSGERPSHPELLDTPGGAFRGRRLVGEEARPGDRPLAHVSPGFRPIATTPSAPTRRTGSSGGPPSVGSTPRRSATPCSSSPASSTPRGRSARSWAKEIGDRPISLIGLDARLPADLDGSRHRSVYLPVLRDRLPDVLDLFDFAEPSLVTGDRETTNVPVQALYLMNSPFVQARAEGLADRLLREADDDESRIRRAFLLCFSRAPAADETKMAASFFARGRRSPGTTRTGVDSSSPPAARPCCRPPNSGTSIRRSPSPMATRHPGDRPAPLVSRRQLLKSSASGFGYLAFAGLAHEAAARDAARRAPGGVLAPKAPHFPARAKRVIFLCMNGGPSHVDTFDYKPALNKQSGEATTIGRDRGGAKLLGSPFKFAQHGESGLWISEVFPHAGQAGRRPLLHPQHAHRPAEPLAGLHADAHRQLPVRAPVGRGLDALRPGERERQPARLRHGEPPVGQRRRAELRQRLPPRDLPGDQDRRQPDPRVLRRLARQGRGAGAADEEHRERATSRATSSGRSSTWCGTSTGTSSSATPITPRSKGAIESFELAFRMQDEVPELLDMRSEPESILKLYGVGPGLPTDRFGRQCIMARRLSEAGVRFIEITAPVGWDHHFLLKDALAEELRRHRPADRRAADRPEAARPAARTRSSSGPASSAAPRMPRAATAATTTTRATPLWMAGGGVKGGLAHGATDEFGYEAVEKPVHVHDWHATILHLLGLDHERLTFNYGGRDFRLTDVYGDVVKEILA